MSASELRIKGSHNLLNVAATLSALVEFGLDYKLALPAVKSFPGLPHRCQWVADVDGVHWYNDSKGTNVGSAIAAIEGLALGKKAQLIWIAGGEGKDADFSPLTQAVSANVSLAVLFGRDAEKLSQSINGSVKTVQVDTLEQAVDAAREHAASEDIVLMSPACASFDQFKDFVDRGNQFMQLVKGAS